MKKPPYLPPYGFVWTGSGFRRLTPRQMIRRQIRQHNRRLAQSAKPRKFDNTRTPPTTEMP